MPDSDVHVSGCGLVLPGIDSPRALWQRVSAQACVLSERVVSEHVDAPFPFGCIGTATHEASRELLPHRLRRFASRVTRLGHLALHRALAAARLDLDQVEPARRALFTVEGDYATGFDCATNAITGTAAQVNPTLGDFIHHCLARRKLDVLGMVKSSSNNALLVNSMSYRTRATGGAFFAGPHGVVSALSQARAALIEDRCDVALVLTVDAWLDPFLLVELHDLGWLAPSLRDLEGHLSARCFDERSRGLVLSDGSAALVLERSTRTDQRGAEVLRLGDTISRSTAPEPSVEGISPCQAGWVIAQGTGLPRHDQAEARLIAARAPHATAVTSARDLLGYAGSSSLVADIALAGQALAHRQLPGMAGRLQPVSPPLPWAHSTVPHPASHQVMVSGRGLHGDWACINVEKP